VLEDDDDYDDVMFFVHAWAEAVVRQLERVKAQREKSRIDLCNNERNEDWSPPDEVVYRNFRAQWVEEHLLVWASYQLERWTRRLATERGEPVPEPDPVLAAVRNTLEHLDEAVFEEGQAVPGPLGRNTSLRSLPGARLWLALGGPGLFVHPVQTGGILQVDEIGKRALAAVRRIEQQWEAKAADQYAEDRINEWFGK
jgi:hypothetical protein